MWDAYITVQTPLKAYTALEEETREVGRAISVIELLLSPEISGILDLRTGSIRECGIGAVNQ